MRPPLQVEKLSATWEAIVAWTAVEIEEARERLEAPGLDPVKAEHERGRIKALRDLLKASALPEPVFVASEPVDYGYAG